MEVKPLKEYENRKIEIPETDQRVEDSAREELLALIQRENLIYLNAPFDKSRFLT